MFFVCAMTRSASPAVGEARVRFCFRRRQRTMAAITPGVPKPVPMPMPTRLEVESLEGFALPWLLSFVGMEDASGRVAEGVGEREG